MALNFIHYHQSMKGDKKAVAAARETMIAVEEHQASSETLTVVEYNVADIDTAKQQTAPHKAVDDKEEWVTIEGPDGAKYRLSRTTILPCE